MNNALFTSRTGLWETPQEFFRQAKPGVQFHIRRWAPFPSMVCVFRGVQDD